MGVDHCDRDLGAAVQRTADLRPRPAHDGEGLFQHRARLGGGQGRADGAHIRTALHRITGAARPVGQYEGIDIVELARRRLAHARGLGPVGLARDRARPGVVAGNRGERARPHRQRPESRRRGRRAHQCRRRGVAVAKRRSIHRHPVGLDVHGRCQTRPGGQGDVLFDVSIHVQNIDIKAVIALGDHPDPADQHPVLVQWETAGIGRETQRRPLRPDQGRRPAPRDEPARNIRTGQLAELHPEQRPAFQACRRGGGREMLLHDHTGGAAGKGIAAGREVGPRDSLGDRPRRSRHNHALQVDIDRRAGPQGDRRRRAGHGIDRQHIADPVGDSDHGGP